MNLDDFQVYVGNLSPSTTDRSLFDYFSSYSGDVLNAKIIKDTSGRSLCYGFVRFAEASSAYKVVTSLNMRISPSKLLDGNIPCVRETYRRSRAEIDRNVDHLGGRTIFIGNVNLAVKDDDLEKAFGKFGIVVVARIIPGRGFGFITFADHTSALAALSEMQDSEIFHQRIFCSWARRDQQEEEEERAGVSASHREEYEDTGDYLLPRPEYDEPTKSDQAPTEPVKKLPTLPSIKSKNEAFVLSQLGIYFNRDNLKN